MEPRFRVLGPLGLWADGTEISLGGDRQRVLLAHLLLNVNEPVTTERLIEAIWPRDPPASAAANVQTYVWRLRRRIPALPEGEGLLTRGARYSMALSPHRLDATEFESLVATARRSGDRARALELLDRAESLWHGSPLQDVPIAPAWEAEIGRLIEARLAATEDRLALRVALGGHDVAIAELGELLTQHPYRERLWEQRMLALDRGGRRAEALALYGEVRERFVSELGIEPGAELCSAHLAILRGEHPREPPTGAGREIEPDAVALRQLPPDLSDFTGRADYLAELRAAMGTTEGSAAPSVTVLAGAPGTGKSALAVHLAHQLAQRFPDGQLYANLQATTVPRDPGEVLAEFLHLLGVVGAALPADTGTRATLFRSRLAGRRVLLVLDDAATAAQIRPLLPAGPGCAVLITTRSRLSEVDGARHVELDVLDPAEARRLLARIAGAERVAGEPEDAAAIVKFCGYFPLAIRIAGARLAGRRGWTLRTLRTRLADESSRLNELRAGQVAARSSFELSVRQLPERAAHAFGLLSLLGGQEFPGWVLDPLLDQAGGEQVLDVLVDANLVALAGSDSSGEPRYRLHDLIRIYAAELLDSENPEPERSRTAAVERMLGALLDLTRHAAAGLPVAFGAAPVTAGGWPLEPALRARLVHDPLAWFAASRSTLAAGVELAVRHGLAVPAWQLAVASVPYFDLRGEYDDWQRSHLLALPAARAAGETGGEAALLRGLGQVHLYRDEYPEAERAMTDAAERYRAAGDRWGEAVAITGLGTLARIHDQPGRAFPLYHRALDGLIEVGDGNAQAQLLAAIGALHRQSGDRIEAASWLEQALRLSAKVGDSHREAKVLAELGALQRDQGRLDESLATLRRSLAMLEELDDERCTAYTLLALGQTQLSAGEAGPARGLGQRALAVFRRTGNGRGERTALALLEQSHRASRRRPGWAAGGGTER